MPVPACVTAPKLLMVVRDRLRVIAIERERRDVGTAPAPSAPVAPPLPTCNVPSLIVVVPELRLVPVKVNVPPPSLVKAPLLAALAPLSVRLAAAAATLIELLDPAVIA